MKVIREYDNGETFLVEMTREELEMMDNVEINEDDEYSLHQQEEDPYIIDLSMSQLKDTEPDIFLDNRFQLDYETLQGILQMDLNNPDGVIYYGEYRTREEMQNVLIRYLFDCLLAHGLLRQE